MSNNWYALENAEEAVDDTKDIITPFNFYNWLKIGIIIFFIGGTISSFPGFSADTLDIDNERESSMENSEIEETVESFLENPGAHLNSTILFALIIILSAVSLIFTYLSGIFRFIFFQNIADAQESEEVKINILNNFSKHSVNGLKYFLFYLSLVFVSLLTVAIVVGSFIINPFGGVALTLLSLPVFLTIMLGFFFMRSFLIPEMMFNQDQGLVESLNVTYNNILKEWKQSILFFIVKFALDIVISVIWGVAFLTGLLLIIIPVALVGAAFYSIMTILVIIPAILGVLSLIVINYAIQVPLQTFLFDYVLKVYQDIAED